MTFSNWKLRKQIMAAGHLPMEYRFMMLVLIDNIDWNTGSKKFTNMKHKENWLKQIAETNGLEWTRLSQMMHSLVAQGFATFDDGVFQLVEKEENWDLATAEDGAVND